MQDYIKLTFVGDVMCQMDLLDAFKTKGGYSFDSALTKVSPMLKESDLACANLETPISFDDTDLSNRMYNFNSPIEFAQAVKKAGFGFVATANNHCLDRHTDGIASTVRSLDSIGLAHTGVFASKSQDRLVCLDVEGMKIGFLSYTYGTNAFANNNYLRRSEHWMVNLLQEQELVNPISRYCFHRPGGLASKVYFHIRKNLHFQNFGCQVYERKEPDFLQKLKIKRDIRNLRKKGADVVVCYAHMGGQYNPEATARTRQIARFLREQGVNIIVGSHEHVVHGSSCEHLAENSVETYSLGNFLDTTGVTRQPFDKMSEYSIAWHVYVDKATRKIRKTSYTICKSVLQGGGKQRIEVVPVYDLMQSETDADKRASLWKDMQTIASRFAEQKIDTPQQEYLMAQAATQS